MKNLESSWIKPSHSNILEPVLDNGDVLPSVLCCAAFIKNCIWSFWTRAHRSFPISITCVPWLLQWHMIDLMSVVKPKQLFNSFADGLLQKNSTEQEKPDCCPVNLIAISEAPSPPHPVRPQKVLQKEERCSVCKRLYQRECIQILLNTCNWQSSCPDPFTTIEGIRSRLTSSFWNSYLPEMMDDAWRTRPWADLCVPFL